MHALVCLQKTDPLRGMHALACLRNYSLRGMHALACLLRSNAFASYYWEFLRGSRLYVREREFVIAMSSYSD